MKFNNVDFDTYFQQYPDENGFFGPYGGAYIADELKPSRTTQLSCMLRKQTQ